MSTRYVSVVRHINDSEAFESAVEDWYNDETTRVVSVQYEFAVIDLEGSTNEVFVAFIEHEASAYV